MNSIIIILLLVMIPIGIFQVVSAAVIAIVTTKENVREHFIYYLIGVLGYGALLYPVGLTVDHVGIGYFAMYFFLGAFGLMIYHILGLIKSWKRSNQTNRHPNPDHYYA